MQQAMPLAASLPTLAFGQPVGDGAAAGTVFRAPLPALHDSLVVVGGVERDSAAGSPTYRSATSVGRSTLGDDTEDDGRPINPSAYPTRSPSPTLRPATAGGHNKMHPPLRGLRASRSGKRAPVAGVGDSVNSTTAASLTEARSSAQALRSSISELGIHSDDLVTVPRHKLSVWPAAASGSKSQLLQQMEQRMAEVETTMQTASGKASRTPPDQKWVAYREVLDVYISHNTMYRPILYKILDQIDEFYDHYRFMKERFTTSQQNVAAVHHKYRAELEKTRTDLTRIIAEQEAKAGRLEGQIKKWETCVDILATRIDQQQGVVEEAQWRLGTEERARSTLSTAIQLKRSALRDMQDKVQQLSQENQSLQQVVTANTDLWRELMEARSQKDEVEANHLENLEKVAADIGKEQQGHQNAVAMMQNFRRVCKRQVEELDKLQLEAAQARALHDEVKSHRDAIFSAYTPRPNWSKYELVFPNLKLSDRKTTDILSDAATYVEDLQTKYEKTAKKLAAAEKLLDFLEQEDFKAAEESELPPPGKYFVGQGTHHGVLPFLRCVGQIRNTHMGKSEMLSIVRDVWNERSATLRAAGGRVSDVQPFADFFLSYLSKRFFNSPTLYFETAYNLMDGLQRFRNTDTDVSIFYRVLTGDMSEEVYRDQQRMLTGLRTALGQLDKTMNERTPKRMGLLKRRILFEVLTRFFPWKSDAEMVQLRSAVSRDMQTVAAHRDANAAPLRDDVDYSYLVGKVDTLAGGEGEKGGGGEGASAAPRATKSEFYRTLKNQHVTALDEFRVEVQEALVASAGNSETVTPKDVRDTIKGLDAGKTDMQILAFIQHLWVLPENQPVTWDLTGDVYELLDAARTCFFPRGAKRPNRPMVVAKSPQKVQRGSPKTLTPGVGPP